MFRCLPPLEELNSAIFGLFCYFRSFFRCSLPGNFSADALDLILKSYYAYLQTIVISVK